MQTLIRLICPFTFALTVWRFGRNLLIVIPVIFFPTPPFFLARPRRFIVLPATGPFLHIEQVLDIIAISFKFVKFLLLNLRYFVL